MTTASQSPPRSASQSPSAPPKPARFLRLPEVIDRVGLSRSSIYRMMARDAFPRPFKPSEVASRWLEADIDRFNAVVLEGRRWSSEGSVERSSSK